MTCLVGLKDENKVYIAADTESFSDGLVSERPGGKIFVNGPYTMAVSGSTRISEILRWADLPAPDMGPLNGTQEGLGPREFMFSVFVPAVKKALREGGSLRTKDGEDEANVSVLVAWGSNLFHLWSDFYCKPVEDYTACGSGREVAFGSLYTSAGMAAEYRVHVAVKAAIKHCASVGGGVDWLLVN